ncbi:Hydrogenase accessory protein hypB [[Clostridium] ultunense Esp]|uniref:hydrogenase nickel incorporation protein HypB n=1 Tax=Thermicanus aegyptius TaxID=94009 RepID=UPI0002B70B04|nr:hydrogenase nickel incorporation protein HypB [Thermicanus aegyptius]CCQ97303.1 Hydrogenase accessory protein hypB [[Clostridium] ultunense Esp]
MEIILTEDVLSNNNEAARFNRDLFRKKNTLTINIMSSPGSGKTTLLEKTVADLAGKYRIGVIEGDLATQKDADRIRAAGAKAVQINTNGTCHLDARMVAKVLPEFQDDEYDLIFIENVGNLICPSSYDLGQGRNITMLSVPEGNDKILKYPVMYQRTELVLLNKIDLIDLLDFSIEEAIEDLKNINPSSRLIPVSARKGTNLEEWYAWIDKAYEEWTKAQKELETK